MAETTTRTLKVEGQTYFHAATQQRDRRSLIRLKGKWLARLFAPDTRVVVQVTVLDGAPALIVRQEASHAQS